MPAKSREGNAVKLKDYAKAIAAIAGAGVTTALTVWGPETQVGHVLIILSAMLTAVTVYAVRNGDKPNAV